MKYLFFFAIATSLLTTGCDAADQINAEDSSSFFSGKPQRITLVDQTHRMETGSFLLPSDWTFQHEIATKPNGAGFVKYYKEANGPDGEIITNLPLCTYSPVLGTNFQGTFDQAVRQTLSQWVSNPRLGQMIVSREAMLTKSFAMASQKAPGLQAYEIPFEAQRNGQSVQGMMYVMSFQKDQFGMFYGDVVMADPAHFSNAKNALFMGANSFEENPQYAELMNRVNQQSIAQQRQMAAARSQQSYQAHQQRMAMRQQSFQAHQNRMQQHSQMMDQSHNQFMNNLNTPSSYNAGSGYGSHDAYIDAIHERQTFQDPYSGQETHQDGYYDYNYTNGLGDYYRTNDPSFDPNSLQGNWQTINPQSPR